MEPIGPGLNLDIPPNASLLANRVYPDHDSLLTPIRAGQMHLLTHRERRRARKNNGALAKRRVRIELVIKEVKTFKAKSDLETSPLVNANLCRAGHIAGRETFAFISQTLINGQQN